MKKRKTIRLNMQFRFLVLATVELLITLVLGWLVIKVIKKLSHVTSHIPYVVWFIILGIIISVVVANFIGKIFFEPIAELGKAMEQVAEGDFKIQLETKSKLKEIQKLYSNFNLMARELGATEIIQTDFVSNVSHEFKTPINAIEGYAALLQDSRQTPKEREQYIDKILFNTGRLSNLVTNILLLSKIDSQAIQSKQRAYRLDEQIRESILMLESRWAEKEIEFEVDLEEIEFTGNESLLFHVWTNLIDNAIKFDAKGGWIHLQLKLDDHQIVFTIEDNGPGIDDTARKHIFDKFYQSDSSHKEEGNGLGLALVKQILNIHNGTIQADNPSYGGCRFTVFLSEQLT